MTVADYQTNYTKAARRHWDAAEELPSKCRSVAGYLYGVAGECAVKSIMKRVGIEEMPDDKRSDPYYAHYPYLANRLRERINGRGAAELNQFAVPNYFNNWNTDMRYSDGSLISAEVLSVWRENAERALANV